MQTVMILDATDISNAVRHYLQSAGHSVDKVHLNAENVSAAVTVRLGPRPKNQVAFRRRQLV